MIKNKDVLEFYADKGAGELIKKCRLQPSGDYEKLAKTFNLPDKEVKEEDTEDEKENKKFYNWLKEQEKQNFSKTLSLAKVTEKDESLKDFIFKPDLNNPLIEKWHLYVSFYAFEEFWAIPPANNKKKNRHLTKESLPADATGPAGALGCYNRCRGLLLWMYEASLSDSDKEHKADADIVKRLKEVVDLRKPASLLESKWRKDVKDKIAENIAKYKKEQQK